MESYDQGNAVWCCPHGAVAKARAPRHPTGFLLAPVRGRDRHVVCAGNCNVAPSRHGFIAVACVVALSHHGRCWAETPVGPLLPATEEQHHTANGAATRTVRGGGHRNPVTPRGNPGSGHLNSSHVLLIRNHEVPGHFGKSMGPGRWHVASSPAL